MSAFRRKISWMVVLMDCCDQILKRRTLGGQAAVPIVHEEHIGIRSVFLRMAQKSVHLIVKVQFCLFVRRTVVICGDFVGLLFEKGGECR